jgi:hypothetical protein
MPGIIILRYTDSHLSAKISSAWSYTATPCVFPLYYTSIIERENNFLLTFYRETLYSVIFIKIPAVTDMPSYSFVDKVEYFGAVCIPWRWRQQASPKCWCLFTELHGATCLKTGSSAQSSYGIWRQFPVSWVTARRLLVAGQQTTLIR